MTLKDIKKQNYKISAELILREQKVDLIIISKSESESHQFFNDSEKALLT